MHHIAESTDYLNNVLCELFKGHGVDALVYDGLVRFPDHPTLWVGGDMYTQYERISQLDVRVGGFDGERVLCESVAGIGDDFHAQAGFAIQRFAESSFHVFLPALFGQPPCHGTERETWTVGGEPRDVYAGLLTSAFGFPLTADGTPYVGFYSAFQKALETTTIPPGTHWVRIYHMRRGSESTCNEVLFDGEAWPEMQALMDQQAWPTVEGHADVRVFLIIKDAQ